MIPGKLPPLKVETDSHKEAKHVLNISVIIVNSILCYIPSRDLNAAINALFHGSIGFLLLPVIAFVEYTATP